MKKKILGFLLVFVLVVALFFIGSGVFLMIAPGTEIFGIKYIGGSASEYSQVQSLTDLKGESIYIDTHGVPITINYTNLYTSDVKFVQNFTGFTRSTHEKARLDIYLDEDGNTHIETKEMIKFLFANQSRDFYLTINLSSVYAMDKNLFINSNSSKITINGNATYQDFNVVTGDALIVKGSVVAENIKYHSGKQIVIDETMKANNYDLSSTGASINVTQAINGDLKAVTKSGDIKFTSCNNVSIKTGSGTVRCFGDGLNSVLGKVDIVTGGGDVILGHVASADENALCNIKSQSGNVSISTMSDGIITSDRGKIKIGEARAVVVNSKLGSVNIDKVEEEIVVNGKNGNVALGELGSVNNVKVFTTTGKINVKNANGVVNLESESSSVYLENNSSENISVVSGRDATLSNLKGKVYIKSNGDIDAKFYGITDNVTIETGSKTDNVNILAENTSYLDVDYDIISSKGKTAKVFVNGETFDEHAKLNSGVHEGRYMIKVRTSYAKVVLKLGI